jgi:S-adenosylmethionine/arginine decarboxylase-like enzyme
LAPAKQPPFTHRTADFTGVSPALLRDSSVIGGLLVAAAGAAGLSAVVPPVMRPRGADGVTGVLWLDADGGHLTVHTFPEREMLLLDVLAVESRDTDKAIDVFVRRVAAKEVHRSKRTRGQASNRLAE